MGRKLAGFLMFLVFFSVFKSNGRVWAQSAEDRDWYQKVKIHADLRLRHESYFRDGGTVVDRDRQRIRFRIGATLNISKGLDIGFRLATGGDSPISTNQSFDDAFDTKDFGLDRAFVAYKTGPARLIGGKMANPFYSTEVTWDGDLSFEGLAEQFRFQLADSTKLFINLGQFALDENATGPVEPFLLAFQAGIEQKFSATVKAKLAVAYYDFLHVKGVALPVGGTVLAEDFDVLDVLGELNFDLGLPVRLQAQFVKNLDASTGNSEDSAYHLGLVLGNKIWDAGDWKFRYYYRVVEADAVVGVFSDSDFHGGGTNYRGSEFGLDIGVAKGVALNFTYFITQADEGPKNDLNILQADIIFKF